MTNSHLFYALTLIIEESELLEDCCAQGKIFVMPYYDNVIKLQSDEA